ncbi:MAG: hypothetical protein ACJ77K_12710 [Bacteroidia bacterium]
MQKRTLTLLLISASFIFFICLCLLSEITYDVGDGIRHFLVSEYSWKHPGLLMYSWGKPFFSLISSPFSQFGLTGIYLFNISCGCLSAWLCYRIAEKLKLRYSFLVFPFLFFMPVYFPTMNSGLTEPFFGLVLITSVYLVFTEKYWLACLLVSFLPFVRTEGNLILPAFMIVLTFRKKAFLIPLLATGTLVYSFIGYLYYDDFLWIIHQNPYNGANSAYYGKGELFHFVKSYALIWGPVLAVLFCAGTIAAVAPLFNRTKKLKEDFFIEECFLVLAPFLIYFVAHSLMWWKGLANSLGLLRVLAAVAPCSALVCLRGLNLFLTESAKKRKAVESALVIIVAALVIWNPFTQPYFPFSMDPAEKTLKEACNWYKNSPYAGKKVVYAHPLIGMELDQDPFSSDTKTELGKLQAGFTKFGEKYLPDSTIIFWDAHFGPNECRLPKDSLLIFDYTELLESFKPEIPFTTFAGDPFEVLVLRKSGKRVQQMDSIFYDLETTEALSKDRQTISSGKAFSGTHSIHLSPNDEYSIGFPRALTSINGSSLKNICVTARFRGNREELKDAMIVVSVDDPGTKKNLYWSGAALGPMLKTDHAEWEPLSFHYDVPVAITPGPILNIYVWNKAKKDFFLDDVSITLTGRK